MTQSGFCVNHPGARAIAVCLHCGVSLCGMCSRFADDGARCERCAEAHETARLVRAQTERLSKPVAPVLQTAPAPDLRAAADTSAKIITWLKWTSIVLLLGGIGTSLYFYAYPRIEVPESPTRAREEAVTAFVKCLQVFRQLGEQMAAGQEPDMTLQCAPPAGLNRLLRDGDAVRVVHTNPQLYGYQAIYVTSTDPEPVVE